MTISPSALYGTASDRLWSGRQARMEGLFADRFGRTPHTWCSAPGRTELGGNHTDHNRGRVLAAAVQIDALAAAEPNGTTAVTVVSTGYERPFVVHLDRRAPLPEETGTSSALIRGVIARLLDLGYAAGGFDAVVHSDVAPGSGLSSSAAFEVLVGVLVSRLFNGDSIPPAVLAAAGQFAENRYFGKPCGLMDQLTSATGGALHINFADPARPVTEQVAFDPEASGYILCVVETGGSHADLTGDYAAIPKEMRSVAGLFGLPDCRDLKRETLLADARRVRAAVGDRAFLRAKHFVDDNARVLRQVRALEAGDFEAFLRLVNESGESSALLLQNCWAPSSPAEQGVALALALTRDHLCNSGGGACRVHGGGFAGTIQAYIPAATMPGYLRSMEAVFGIGCVVPLAVRSAGAVAIETPALLSQ